MNIVIRRMFRYAVASITFFVLDLLVVFVLTGFFHAYYVASVVIGFTTTTVALFFANRTWTFGKNVHPLRAIYAVLVAVTTLGIVTGLTYLGVEYFGLYYIVARVVAAWFGLAWSYLGDSLFTFEVRPLE
ncbi:MAG: GtrA family protein [bacterium]|nr:GtrA family protein [bacterium]